MKYDSKNNFINETDDNKTIFETKRVFQQRIFSKLLLLFLMLLLVCNSSITVFAHSGRTDGSGGHRDNKNKSGLGSYHYHCGGYPAHLHNNGYCPYTDVMPRSVKISTSKQTLRIGETIAISTKVSPSNAVDTNASLKSSNTNVIKIKNGELIAVGYGTATITATTFNNKKTSIKITVKEIAAKKIAIKENPEKMLVNDETNLTVTFTPEDVDNTSVTWSSSDDSIATVQNGTVKAIAPGTVTITAKSSNGIKDSRTILIEEIVAEKIELKLSSALIHHASEKIEVIYYPENTTYKDIVWENETEDIVSIDSSGVVTALNIGKAKINAKQKDTTATIIFDVIPKNVEDIIITTTMEDDLYLGDSIEFFGEVFPADATYPEIYWKVDNEKIASIDKNGCLKATGLGKTDVIAYTKDGFEKKYEIEVSLSPTILYLGTFAAISGGAGIYLKKRKKNSMSTN